ncbi:hypothetical protein E6O75_ATG03167 [Venturia nashicola]|uniref:Uncharacterized protein n=1 Tax=Venturia nashicola TaxID=86259 RepID=A0A4Z1PEG0_9PEZI|nr:hypothetical protein E6O75_ATG03167 [Venturia nashicola]
MPCLDRDERFDTLSYQAKKSKLQSALFTAVWSGNQRTRLRIFMTRICEGSASSNTPGLARKRVTYCLSSTPLQQSQLTQKSAANALHLSHSKQHLQSCKRHGMTPFQL